MTMQTKYPLLFHFVVSILPNYSSCTTNLQNSAARYACVCVSTDYLHSYMNVRTCTEIASVSMSQHYRLCMPSPNYNYKAGPIIIIMHFVNPHNQRASEASELSYVRVQSRFQIRTYMWPYVNLYAHAQESIAKKRP